MKSIYTDAATATFIARIAEAPRRKLDIMQGDGYYVVLMDEIGEPDIRGWRVDGNFHAAREEKMKAEPNGRKVNPYCVRIVGVVMGEIVTLGCEILSEAPVSHCYKPTTPDATSYTAETTDVAIHHSHGTGWGVSIYGWYLVDGTKLVKAMSLAAGFPPMRYIRANVFEVTEGGERKQYAGHELKEKFGGH